jgi:hypothetical protein
MDKECQVKTPDVGVSAKKSPRNSGTRVAVDDSVRDVRQSRSPVRLTAKSVFEVDSSRLGIGVFSRPLLDAECRKFRKAWEMEALPGFEDVQVDKQRISFVARPDAVPQAWDRIDNLLATATEGVKKAS